MENVESNTDTANGIGDRFGCGYGDPEESLYYIGSSRGCGKGRGLSTAGGTSKNAGIGDGTSDGQCFSDDYSHCYGYGDKKGTVSGNGYGYG